MTDPVHARAATADPTLDVAVVGAGAAGLMAAIAAARTAPSLRIAAFDGARSIGAKILVAGGGRCNVTHEAVTERDYAGSTPAAIRKVLSRFSVEDTVAFFAERGVALKREDTGKLFPTTDRARSVLDALLGAARDAGAEVLFPWRVRTLTHDERGFVLRFAAFDPPRPEVRARRVVLAAGGMALPKSGSDGAGYALAQAFGHALTPLVVPALVPLRLAEGHPLRTVSGIATDAAIEVRAATGRRLHANTGSVLCTHFGLSGPAILDASRHLAHARHADPDAHLVLNWLPGETVESIDASLRELGRRTPQAFLRERLPERLALALCEVARIDPRAAGARLAREDRRAFAHAIVSQRVPVVGDRGWTHAEVTAGGIPLAEVDLRTMESRRRAGLHLCGEILDVDGRIGGFNFQWAWASGFVAGTAAGAGACAGA